MPFRAHGREGVNGSSPLEGFARAPHTAPFFWICCTCSRCDGSGPSFWGLHGERKPDSSSVVARRHIRHARGLPKRANRTELLRLWQLRRFYKARKLEMQEMSVGEVSRSARRQGHHAQREMTHAGTGCNRVHDAERHGDPRPRWSHRIRLRASGRRYDVAADHGRGRRAGLFVLSRQRLRHGNAEQRRDVGHANAAE